MLSLYPKFRFVLLLFFIFAMHFTLITPGGSGLYLPFNVMSWIVVSIIIAVGLWQITVTKTLYFHKLHLFLAIGFTLLLVPMWYGGDFTDYAIPRLLGLLTGLIFLFSINQFQLNKSQNNDILYLILIGISISATVSLFQFYFVSEPDFWPGYTPGSTRPIGLFLQPNVIASFLATGLLLALYLFTTVEDNEHKKWHKPLLFFTLFSAALLLVLLQSRVGFLGAIIALALMLPFVLKQNMKKTFLALLIIISGISSAFLSTAFIETPNRGSEVYKDAGARSDMYRVSTHMIYDRPLTGFGYGDFERNYREFHLAIMQINPDLKMPLDNLDHPHNEILLWGVEGGILPILGLLVFALGYFYLFANTNARKAFAYIALLTPILLHTQTEYPFYHSVPHWVVFLLIINFTQQGLTSFSIKPLPQTFLVKFIAIINLVIIIPFMLTTFHTGYLLKEYAKSDPHDEAFIKRIINPLPWKALTERVTYNHRLEVGFANQDAKALVDYIEWGRRSVELTPREKVFQNMITAIQTLHNIGEPIDEKISISLILDAEKIYPERKVWGLDAVKKVEVATEQDQKSLQK
ncbi:Wzy polymerase domain-containing protein [Thalassotalea psychrophila]|uniref:Wzy polymerase domain-containing protein n=1 Tax=Thalassotalea psychrophila TaxID=3065647 RepID=A0ABY9TZK1_9GAMM|nr:Wzy polymerase domain-containing protein [Colwelliaceae bacterium SQ149]